MRQAKLVLLVTPLDGRLVRPDSCGEEYSYKPKEVARADIEVLDNFTPQPLFNQT